MDDLKLWYDILRQNIENDVWNFDIPRYINKCPPRFCWGRGAFLEAPDHRLGGRVAYSDGVWNIDILMSHLFSPKNVRDTWRFKDLCRLKRDLSASLNSPSGHMFFQREFNVCKTDCFYFQRVSFSEKTISEQFLKTQYSIVFGDSKRKTHLVFREESIGEVLRTR